MAFRIAHDLNEKWRSDDIKLEENIDFSGLLLSEKVLEGLKKSGYVKPSPIQLRAIPLGRCGLDLIVQAKSGTGKTCVFTVIALENLLDSLVTQVLVLAPTREIAAQICDVVQSIGCEISDLNCCMFIGGLSIVDDKENLKKCQIAVGTPGRIKQLIEEGYLKTHSIRLFVLDEADKLLDKSFQENINWIYSSLPVNKQMLALSATYPEELATLLTNYMRNPAFVRLNVEDPALLGITQFYKLTSFHPMQHLIYQHKLEVLWKILNAITFSQCLIFCNLQTRVQTLSDALNQRGYPSVHISGNQDQNLRLETMDQLKTFQCRVLVTTDLTSRGIDAENVNLVVNMDVPYDVETYLHRIGRAGRYGTQGISITLAASGEEENKLMSFKNQCHFKIHLLPDPMPADLWNYASEINEKETISLITQGKIEETLINENISNGEKQPAVENSPSLRTNKDQSKVLQPDNTVTEKANNTSEDSSSLEHTMDKVLKIAKGPVNSEPNNKISYICSKGNIYHKESNLQQTAEKSKATEFLDAVEKNKSSMWNEEQKKNEEIIQPTVDQENKEKKSNNIIMNTIDYNRGSENQDSLDSKRKKSLMETISNLCQIPGSSINTNLINVTHSNTASDMIDKRIFLQNESMENEYISNDHTYHNRTLEAKQNNSDKFDEDFQEKYANFELDSILRNETEKGLELLNPLVQENEKHMITNDSSLNSEYVEITNLVPGSENSSTANALKNNAIGICQNKASEIKTVQRFNLIQPEQICLENNEIIEISEELPLYTLVPTDDFFITLFENLQKRENFVAKSEVYTYSEMSNILQTLLKCGLQNNDASVSYEEAIKDFEHFLKNGTHLDISKRPFHITSRVFDELNENQLCVLNSYLNQKNYEFLSEVHSNLKDIREMGNEIHVEEQKKTSEDQIFSEASLEKTEIKHFQSSKRETVESSDAPSKNIALSKDATVTSYSKTDTKDLNARLSITNTSSSEVLLLQSNIKDSLKKVQNNTNEKDLLPNAKEMQTEIATENFTADIRVISSQNEEKLTKQVVTSNESLIKQKKNVQSKNKTNMKEFIPKSAKTQKKELLMIEKNYKCKQIHQKTQENYLPMVNREIKSNTMERAVRMPVKTYIPSISFENTKQTSYSSNSKQKPNTYKPSIFKQDKTFYAKNRPFNSSTWGGKTIKHSKNMEQIKFCRANSGHNRHYKEVSSDTSSCSSKDISLSFTSPQKTYHHIPRFANGNYTPATYFNIPLYDSSRYNTAVYDKHQSVVGHREINERTCECHHYREYYRLWQWYEMQHKNREAFDFYRRYMEQWTYLHEMCQWWKH